MKQILIALGHSKDEKVLMDLLKNTFNLELSIIKPFDIRKQDSGSIYSSIAKNYQGRNIVWQFYKDNFDTIKEYLGTGSLFRSVTVSSSKLIGNKDHYNDVELFLKKMKRRCY